MSDDFVRFEKRGHVAWVTLNRPEVMNALHPPCHDRLDAIWDEFAADPDLWVAILTGAGERAFCAGNDLKWTAQNQNQMPPMPRGGFAGLATRGLKAAQILLTLGDTEERRRYLNARHTIETLIAHGAVPVVNEDSSLARYTASAAISSTRPSRPIGWRAMNAASTCASVWPLAWA